MKIFKIISLLLLGPFLQAQIKFSNIENNGKIKEEPLVYDSTMNFLPQESSYLLKGRILFSIYQEMPTYAFRKKNNFNDWVDLQIYLPESKMFIYTNYDSIVGNYFKVLDVLIENDTIFKKNKYILKLLDIKRDAVIYFEYPEFNSSFPFMVLDFYEKEKLKLNKKFRFYDNFYLENAKTGINDKINSSKVFRITDFTIDQMSFQPYYILLDSLGNKYNVDLGTMEIIKGSIKFLK